MKMKQGATFIAEGRLKEDETALDISGYIIKSQVRQGNKLVCDLNFSLLSNTTYRLSGDTSAWPIGFLSCDVKYTTTTGQVLYTETFTIEIERRITI